MVKTLLKKQFTEIFRSYFYDTKKNKARSKAGTIAYFVLFVLIMAGMLGGIFWLTPLLVATFLLLFKRFRGNLTREKGILIVVSMVLALVIVVFDAQVAGVLQRYFMDFGIFLALPAVLAIGSIWGSPNQPLPLGADIAEAESILEVRQARPAFTGAGMLLMLLVFATALPGYRVVLGL